MGRTKTGAALSNAERQAKWQRNRNKEMADNRQIAHAAGQLRELCKPLQGRKVTIELPDAQEDSTEFLYRIKMAIEDALKREAPQQGKKQGGARKGRNHLKLA